MEKLLNEVRPIIAKRLRCSEDKITADTLFRQDLGADSIDLVELVMSIENEYDIEFSDEATESIQSVGDALTYLQQELAKK